MVVEETTAGEDVLPKLPKLRSNSIQLAPRNSLLDSIDALSNEKIAAAVVAGSVQQSAITGPSPLAGLAKNHNDDGDDTTAFGSAPTQAEPLEVEVVELEQLGVDTLYHARTLPSSASALSGSGSSSGRPFGRAGGTVFYNLDSGSHPMGLNTLRAKKETQTRNPAVSLGMFKPQGQDSAGNIAPRSSLAMEKTPPKARSPPPVPPLNRLPPPPVPVSASASSLLPRSPPALDTGTPDSPTSSQQQQQQEVVFHTPSSHLAAAKNALQSPAAPRSQLLPSEMVEKNPLQSPAVGKRGNTVSAATFQLGPFQHGDHTLPLPPLHSLNDADLLKNSLQSPGPAPPRRQSFLASQQEPAALPPPVFGNGAANDEDS